MCANISDGRCLGAYRERVMTSWHLRLGAGRRRRIAKPRLCQMVPPAGPWRLGGPCADRGDWPNEPIRPDVCRGPLHRSPVPSHRQCIEQERRRREGVIKPRDSWLIWASGEPLVEGVDSRDAAALAVGALPSDPEEAVALSHSLAGRYHDARCSGDRLVNLVEVAHDVPDADNDRIQLAPQVILDRLVLQPVTQSQGGVDPAADRCAAQDDAVFALGDIVPAMSSAQDPCGPGPPYSTPMPSSSP